MVKSKTILTTLLSLCLLSGCNATSFTNGGPIVTPTPIPTAASGLISDDYHYATYNGKEYKFNPTIATILFMGVDTSEDEGIGRADSIQLYLLNRSSETMQVLSISRDLQIPIRLFDLEHNDLGWETRHLALAYSFGSSPTNGAMLTAQAISRMLNNIPINYFVGVDLTNIKLLHSVVGNLEVTIPNDSLVDKDPTWVKGATITLTENNVETYLRTRDTEKDFSNNERMERQSVYLNAYFEKLSLKLENDFENTVSLLYNVSSELITNISYSDIESFANMLITYTYDSSKDFYTIEGTDVLGEFHDEYYLDKELLNELIINLFYEER